MTEPVVSYPITEVLRKIDEKIDKLLDRLAGKADQSSLDSLARTVASHEEHLRRLLESQRLEAAADKNRVEWRKWVIPVILSVMTLVVTALTIVGH